MKQFQSTFIDHRDGKPHKIISGPTEGVEMTDEQIIAGIRRYVDSFVAPGHRIGPDGVDTLKIVPFTGWFTRY